MGSQPSPSDNVLRMWRDKIVKYKLKYIQESILTMIMIHVSIY